MYRRQLLKYLGATGLGLSIPLPALSQQGSDPDRFWVLVNAGGGWDPTSFIDPKGDVPRRDDRGPVNNYSVNAITTAGNILYPSAYPNGIDEPEADSGGHFANFFPKHSPHMLVINGIDTQTNNHSTGSRFVWSGRSAPGYPSFGALAAASTAPAEPMAYISNGGYDQTAGLVAPSRGGSHDLFSRLAFPNASRPRDPDPLNHRPYFDTEVYPEIELARKARQERLLQDSSLPLQQEQISKLMLAQVDNAKLNRLVSFLPSQVSRGMEGQAEIAVAAFASGVAVAANLNVGGFDTHGNHDVSQTRAITRMLAGVDHLWDEIVAKGLEDRVTVLVGSDFGRTPFYNDRDGKDHWNVTSMMAMGAGVRGDRVIGATNDHVEALKINPLTLELDPDGITLTPEHIHVALRTLAGIPSYLDGQFGIAENHIDLFS